MGTVAFLHQVISDPAGTVNFLEPFAECFDILGGFAPRVGIAKAWPVANVTQIFVAKGGGHGIWLTKIPCLQFLADDAYQDVVMSGLLAKVSEPQLESNAVLVVVVTDDSETVAWFAPATELVLNIIVKVRLAFMGNTEKVQVGKYAR